jgi:hypothetical protein
LEERNVEKYISTCQFAQRVALINSEGTLDESFNPMAEFEMLKTEIERLK